MASPRRRGTERSRTRIALIEAAAKIMRQQGYAAVTTREVAAKAGLKPQLVHYYFRSMDDLFLAVLRFGADHRLKQMARAIASDDPVRALWELNRDPRSTAMTIEFVALVNHRPVVRAELKRISEQYRDLQTEALNRYLQLRGISSPVPPVVWTLLMAAISQVLVREEAIDMSTGHAEIEAIIDAWLCSFSTKRKPALRARPKISAQLKPRSRGKPATSR